MSIPLQLTLGNTALVWVKALYEHVHVPLHILIENKTTGAPKCIDHFQQIVISWVDLIMRKYCTYIISHLFQNTVYQ